MKHLGSNGNPMSLARKLERMPGNPNFTQNYVRKRITEELLDDISIWKDKRNKLIHALIKQPYDAGNLRDMANEGNELVKKLDNKVRSVNKYFDKQMKDT